MIFIVMKMILEEICSVGIFVCEKLCINNLLKSKQSNYNDMWIMINGDGDDDDDDSDIGSAGRVKRQDNGSPLTRHSRSMKTIIN